MISEQDTITIFIAAHSAIVRAGLESVLRTSDAFVVTGSAAEISAASSGFSFGQIADVILINIEREKDFDDLQEFLKENAGENDAPAIVALLPIELQTSVRVMQILQNGARAILPHDAAANEIAAAVTAAANNLVSLLPETLENFWSFLPLNDLPSADASDDKTAFSDETVENLTTRETEVLEMLVDGASNKSIASQLNISEHTVKFHVASIFGKFGVNTRTEAVTQALRRGLILL